MKRMQYGQWKEYSTIFKLRNTLYIIILEYLSCQQSFTIALTSIASCNQIIAGARDLLPGFAGAILEQGPGGFNFLHGAGQDGPLL